MSTEAEFQASLDMGTAAEEIVYSYLIRNHSLVQDMRKQVHEDYKGPRLVGTEGEYVLPDFGVTNKDPRKGNFLIDVKAKTRTYPVKGKECFTVDRKYEQYKAVREILRYDFLMMAFLFENRMYFYHESECCGTHQFRPNQFGDGFVYLFPYEGKKPTY